MTNTIEQISQPPRKRPLVVLRPQPKTPSPTKSQDLGRDCGIWGTPHNGWSNYETWQVYFSIAAEDAIYQFWLGRAAHYYCRPEVRQEQCREDSQQTDGRHFSALFDEMCHAFYQTPLVSSFGVHSELLMTALGPVDWQSLASGLQCDYLNRSREEATSLLPNSLTDRRIRFSAGGVTASSEILQIISQKELVDSVIRHQRGDWGLVDEKQRQANEAAINAEGYLISAYQTKNKVEFWIVTDYDRAATNVLLPSEY